MLMKFYGHLVNESVAEEITKVGKSLENRQESDFLNEKKGKHE